MFIPVIVYSLSHRPAQRLEEAVRGGRRGGEGEAEERAPRPAPRKRLEQRGDLDLSESNITPVTHRKHLGLNIDL